MNPEGVLGGRGEGLAEAERVELEVLSARQVSGIVDLGGHQQHGFAGASQPVGDLLVGAGLALAAVDAGEDQLDIDQSGLDPLPDVARPVVAGPEANGIEDAERTALVGGGQTLLDVAGHPREVRDYRLARPDQAIEEARLADVRSADDGYASQVAHPPSGA